MSERTQDHAAAQRPARAGQKRGDLARGTVAKTEPHDVPFDVRRFKNVVIHDVAPDFGASQAARFFSTVKRSPKLASTAPSC